MEQIKKPLTIHVQTYKERAKKSNVREKLSHMPRGMHLIQWGVCLKKIAWKLALWGTTSAPMATFSIHDHKSD